MRTPAPAVTRLLRLLLIGSIVVPLAVLAGGGYLAWVSTRERAEADLVRRVAIAEEHALKVLDTHQLVAGRINDLVGNLSDQAILIEEQVLHGQLAQEIKNLPQVQTALVIGRNGHPLVSATVYPVNRNIDLSDRTHFQALREHADPYYVSVIEVGRLDSERHFFLSRRKESEPGSFDGVITVTVSPKYFQDFYGKLVDASPDYTAGLVRIDGADLVLYPMPALGEHRDQNLLNAAAEHAPSGIFRARSAIDGVDRLAAYDKLPNYPAYATVARSWDSIVAEWQHTMLTHLLFGVPATLGLVALSLLALRRTRFEQAAMQEAREATRQRDVAEEALRQSQKMEAIGHLTGGVAHDFNNLLTVVMGNIELAQRQLENWTEGAQDRMHRTLAQAMRGAQRGAMLTQRLLAFSRRQPLSPKPLDLNKLVGGLTEFLRRSLGETVELQTVGAAGLWKVEADPVQLEAALLNLAVNARDAMPNGGKLTIETANVQLDPDYCRRHAEVKPGPYVQIAVTDTGTGMSRQVLDRAFEPFFTTKVAGQGTGLGLSQVFGFVKQSGGHITIYSEVGEGTTVKIYLPRLFAELREEVPVEREVPGAVPGERVLVVEDDEEVRLYIADLLRGLRYQVIEAADATAALAQLERGNGHIDLLLTDVVLPGMNGRRLADEVVARANGIKVLFMTGYSRNAIVRHGRLDPRVEMIQKPFTEAALAARIRDVLDQASGIRNRASVPEAHHTSDT
ncbi:MAG: response regulator [Hyphomicrobiales bacterium]|nr:response regulator [Hyphomicrobiales bacterium]MBV8826675.1 response regulator [Hyphomicrobiales bacterium]MBV9427761.1 response regulator [Bradyrhizobiaceae bacterium]